LMTASATPLAIGASSTTIPNSIISLRIFYLLPLGRC
jgi:hypothetical protein